MNASDYAAWYGAILATAVLVWDILKWRQSGPQIKAEARSGWRTFGFDEKGDVMFVKATNTGDRPTTLTSWGLYWYPTGVPMHEKSKRKAVVINGELGGSGVVPTKLEPGDVWTGISKETDDLKAMIATGTCYVALGFSHVEEEILVQVK